MVDQKYACSAVLFCDHVMIFNKEIQQNISQSVQIECQQIHHAALITQQSLAAKLTLKCQIDFPATSMVYWMNIPRSTCKVL